MKTRLLLLFVLLYPGFCGGQDLPLLKVSDDKSYIVTSGNQPFLWLGGTAWEMIHRLNREEIDLYLADRASKGFTVIQTVILAELDGLNKPNAYGDLPLVDNDPGQLNEKYFELVDYVVTRGADYGLYIGLLPTWGDKFNKHWGAGPEIFTPANAGEYAGILAKRYLDHSNVIWILGGDRIPESEEHFAIINGMARGIRNVDSLHLITYHPVGGQRASDFFSEEWLNLDMCQTGHSRTSKEYAFIADSKNPESPRPIINGESRYENIPDRFWENKSYGWLDDSDVRVSAYWSMLAGAAGYTYGCNDIWQMYDLDHQPVIQARTGWRAAIDLPGSAQMGYMKQLFEILPWQQLSPNQSLILNENPEDESYRLCASGLNNRLVLAYTPFGKPVKIDPSKIDAEKIRAYWFNPRSGSCKFIGEFATSDLPELTPWASGRGSDFLLILVAEGLSIYPETLNLSPDSTH